MSRDHQRGYEDNDEHAGDYVARKRAERGAWDGPPVKRTAILIRRRCPWCRTKVKIGAVACKKCGREVPL